MTYKNSRKNPGIGHVKSKKVGGKYNTLQALLYFAVVKSRWRHQLETFSALLALCVRVVPLTKASDAELWCFLWSAPIQLMSWYATSVHCSIPVIIIPWICYERSFSEFYLSIWKQMVFNQRLQLFVIRTLHDCPSQMNENLLISNSKLTSDSELIWWR